MTIVVRNAERLKALPNQKKPGEVPVNPLAFFYGSLRWVATYRLANNITSCIEKSFATSFSRALTGSWCPALIPSTQI